MQGTRPVDVAFVARRAKTPVRSHGQTAWCPTRLIKKAPMSSRSRSVVVGTARRTPHLWLCAGSSPAPCVAPRSPRLGRCRSSSPATTRCRFPGACTRRNRGRLGKRCRRRMRTALFSPAPPPVARRWHDSPNPSCPAQASWQPRRRSWCLAVTTNRGGYEHTGPCAELCAAFPPWTKRRFQASGDAKICRELRERAMENALRRHVGKNARMGRAVPPRAMRIT
jgi:hypothetical protein